MYTKKFFGCGLIAVILAAIFALSLTGCEQATDPPNVSQPVVTLTGITAEYEDTATIYSFTLLDSLKDRLTVKARYSDGSETTLDAEDYALSGTLTAGSSTVTVSFTEDSVNKTTTFNVTVSSITLESIAVEYDPGTATIYTSTPLNDLKEYLTVIATYSDQNESELAASEYTLSGTLTAGTSTITVEYGDQSETFEVTVVAVALTGITASYTGTATIYPTTQLDSLKTNLTVKAQYSDGSEEILIGTAYTLSGTLTVGNSTITVSYTEDSVTKTTTFDVTVTAASGSTITWALSQKGGVPVAGSTPTASTTAIVITFTGAVSLTDADITIGGAAERNTASPLSATTGNTVWEVPVTVSGSDNATVTVTKNGVEDGTQTVMVYKAVQSPTANPASGVTTYIGNEKIVFSATTASDSSGTYTMYKTKWDDTTDQPVLDTLGHYEWGRYQEGNYTWNSQTITLTPTLCIVEDGTSITSDNALGYLTTIAAAWKEEMMEEGMSGADAEALILEELNGEMGTNSSTLDEGCAAYAIWLFSPRAHTYAFINSNILFLQEPLPTSTGTDELTGKTFNTSSKTGNNSQTNGQTYTFTNGIYTVTDWDGGGTISTGSYSYSSSIKYVRFKPTTVEGKNPEQYYTDLNPTDMMLHSDRYLSEADFRMARTVEKFRVERSHYDPVGNVILK